MGPHRAPTVRSQPEGLFPVWGTSADNVRRGCSWRHPIMTGLIGPKSLPAPRDLVSLWGTGPNDILVAGGRANGLLAR